MKCTQAPNTWCVYKHTSPSGKVYIGITHHANPEKRWGNNGNLYGKDTVFYKAILKYGWDNIEHEILYSNCSEEEAKSLEISLIAYYKELGLSYNMTIGGDGHNFGKESRTAEYRTKSSRKYREEHPDYDKEQYEKHKEHKKENARRYYRNNREKVLAQKKSTTNKEKARIRAAEWRKAHPNYMKEYMEKYNRTKKESCQIS